MAWNVHIGQASCPKEPAWYTWRWSSWILEVWQIWRSVLGATAWSPCICPTSVRKSWMAWIICTSNLAGDNDYKPRPQHWVISASALAQSPHQLLAAHGRCQDGDISFPSVISGLLNSFFSWLKPNPLDPRVSFKKSGYHMTPSFRKFRNTLKRVQICITVQSRKKMLHRDIKPEILGSKLIINGNLKAVTTSVPEIHQRLRRA